MLCENTCSASNGACIDGGPGAVASLCVYGTDCAACGPRLGVSFPPNPPSLFIIDDVGFGGRKWLIIMIVVGVLLLLLGLGGWAWWRRRESRRLAGMLLGASRAPSIRSDEAKSADVELADTANMAINKRSPSVTKRSPFAVAIEAAQAEAAARKAREAAEAAAREEREAAAAAEARRLAEEAKRAAEEREAIEREVNLAGAAFGIPVAAARDARESLVAQMSGDTASSENRFSSSTELLKFGRMQDAARGVESYVCVPSAELHRGMAEGLAALRREIELNGTDDDQYCMRYVLDECAGASDVVWPNGNLKFDCDSSGAVLGGRQQVDGGGGQSGMRLKDFVNHPKAKLAELSEVEVAALRLYTTSMYKSINAPLRDVDRRARKEPHPLPLTVVHIKNAVLKLRAVGAEGDDANQTVELYRGMRNVELPDEFVRKGGTELAPMSTTADINIALRYSASAQGVFLRLRTHSSMERGADLTFLSCFPGEREYLFPPLTYLQLVKPVKTTTVALAAATFTVIEVEPKQ